MALDSEDILELLRYLQARVRDAGLAAWDEAIVEDLREVDASPARLLLMYLEALDAAFAAHSRSTVRATLDRLNEFVEVEEGSRVESIRIQFAGADAALAGTEQIDLADALPDLQNERAALRDLAAYIQRESEGHDLG